MMFVPGLYPQPTFVFFFEKGDTGRSWSIRDYSEKGRRKTFYAAEFGWTADQVRGAAEYSFDAPPVDTNDINYWHERTLDFNQRYLANLPRSSDLASARKITADRDTAHAVKDMIGQYLKVSKRDHIQDDLARRAKVSAATISRIRHGQKSKKSSLVAVANVINEELPCTADDLLPPGSPEAL